MAPKEAWTFGSLKLSVLVKEAACCASTATGDVARRAVTVGVRGVVLVSSKPNGAIAIQRGIGISLADSVRCVGGHHEWRCVIPSSYFVSDSSPPRDKRGAQVDGKWRDCWGQICPPTRLEPAAAGSMSPYEKVYRLYA